MGINTAAGILLDASFEELRASLGEETMRRLRSHLVFQKGIGGRDAKEVLAQAIDSIEYVQKNWPDGTGSGVRTQAIHQLTVLKNSLPQDA